MITLVWLSPLLAPLIGVVVTSLRPGPRTSWVLIAAPVPAALFAIVGPPDVPPTLAWLLLDTNLALDPVGRLLLGLTAAAWIVAGIYARADAEQGGGYADWWLLALFGNIGVVIAADVISFYAAFVVMTLAAYGLVVHRREPSVRRAGRIYLVLGVAGETALLAGLLLASAGASGLELAEVAAAIAGSGSRDLIIALLIVGFGIKAGVLGLHVWLPLAHPAAPFAASAVLSGAMIKAGVIGWLRLLPIGEEALPGWSTLLIGLGFLTAFGGVALGLTQRGPKVVLAYSSVSQMGFLTVLVGVALATPDVARLATAAAAAYALHHGLAKAALFLAVGLLPGVRAGWRRRVVLAGIAVAGLSLAGAPLSSGAFAKAWMKQSMDLASLAPWTVTVASLAAAGTTALVVWLMVLLLAQRPDTDTSPQSLAPWFALLIGVLLATPLMAARLLPELGVPGPGSLVLDAGWPVLLGLTLTGVVALAGRRVRIPVPDIPAGDLVVLGERAVTAAWRSLHAVGTPTAQVLTRTATAARQAAVTLSRRDEVLDRLEERLTRWRTGGVMVALVLAALAITLLFT
jgi:hydrogenase-4 component B